jgi:hypothetical protein
MPLPSDEVVLALNPKSPRVQVMTALRVLAVDTGVGFVFMGGDEEGVAIATATTHDDIDLHAFVSHVDAACLKHLRSMKWDLDQLYGLLNKNPSSGIDLVVAARSLLTARSQLAALEVAIAEARDAVESSVAESLRPAEEIKSTSIAKFISASEHYTRLFQRRLRGCERMLSHFLEIAALRSVDMVFFQHAAEGFRVVFDDTTSYTISFSSLQFEFPGHHFGGGTDQEMNRLKAHVSRLETLSSHHLEREDIEAMSQALSMKDAESLRLLAHVKVGLYDRGYRLGSYARNPIVVSLWGNDSPIGKSRSELYGNPISLEKFMVLHASLSVLTTQEKISFDEIKFVSKYEAYVTQECGSTDADNQQSDSKP